MRQKEDRWTMRERLGAPSWFEDEGRLIAAGMQGQGCFVFLFLLGFLSFLLCGILQQGHLFITHRGTTQEAKFLCLLLLAAGVRGKEK